MTICVTFADSMETRILSPPKHNKSRKFSKVVDFCQILTIIFFEFPGRKMAKMRWLLSVALILCARAHQLVRFLPAISHARGAETALYTAVCTDGSVCKRPQPAVSKPHSSLNYLMVTYLYMS